MTGSRTSKAIVTGGAGFIGSQIVDRLLEEGSEVVLYDNFSTGQRRYLDRHAANPRLSIVEADVLDFKRLHSSMAECDAVFHFQANADVRGGIKNTRVDLEQNTIATWNVLEGMRAHGIPRITFASSATVYGEPEKFPTSEDVCSSQTSLYGASKLSCEAMIQAYSAYYGIRGDIFRFVSWIGERYSHGVIYDFVAKLRRDATRLEILGDGNQRKSYLYATDGIDGIFTAMRAPGNSVGIYNLGHTDFLNVKDLATIVIDEIGLKNVKLEFTGGERGWIGDSPFVHLDVSKMKRLGWKPRTSIEEGIRRTVRFLNDNLWIFDGRK